MCKACPRAHNKRLGTLIGEMSGLMSRRALGGCVMGLLLLALLPHGAEAGPQPPSEATNPLNHYIYAGPYDFMYCWIEKVGSTRLKNVFPLCRFYECVQNKSAGESHEAAEARTWSPDWYRFAFVREPLGRFLSAYLHKCLLAKDQEGCKHIFGGENSTFDDAINYLQVKQIVHAVRFTCSQFDTVPTTLFI